MSVLKKMPWIQAKLSTLSTENLSTLLTAMNSDAQIEHVYSLYDNARFIPALEEEGDVVIQNCVIEFERGKHPYTGFLIHTDTMCIFIAYHRFQDLALFEIDNTNKTFVKINEECSIEELRRIVEGDAGLDNAWVDKMKEHLDYSPTTEERIGGVECGTNLHVDGSLYVNSNVGEVVRQDAFMNLNSIHADITITDFSAYALGQLVIVHFKYTTESIAANEKLFDINNAYKPNKEQVRLCVNNSGEAIAFKMATGGRVDTLSSVSGTPAKTVYMDFIYEV